MNPTVVQYLTSIRFWIKPKHKLPAEMLPVIKIDFPYDIGSDPDGYLVQQSCEAVANTDIGSSLNCMSDVIYNSLIVMGITKTIDAEEVVSLTIGKIKIPGHIGGGKGNFKVTTFLFESSDNSYNEVDEGFAQANSFLTPTSGSI